MINALREFLLARGDSIFQLVPPGGQAPFSFTFFNEERRRKTVYPDLICIEKTALVIGECKASFSKNDYRKLFELKMFGVPQIKKFWKQRIAQKLSENDSEIKFVLCHGGSRVEPVEAVHQWILQGKSFLEVRPLEVGNGVSEYNP